MTTTEYWTNAAAVRAPAGEGPREGHRAVNWRLMLALGLNLIAWAAILKST